MYLCILIKSIFRSWDREMFSKCSRMFRIRSFNSDFFSFFPKSNIFDENAWKLDFFYTHVAMIFEYVNNCQDIWDAWVVCLFRNFFSERESYDDVFPLGRLPLGSISNSQQLLCLRNKCFLAFFFFFFIKIHRHQILLILYTTWVTLYGII